MSALDSLMCRVVAMRTAAVDGIDLPRHTILFIKETAWPAAPMATGTTATGMPPTSAARSTAAASTFFTGDGAHSMSPLMPLNLATLTVMKAGVFHGCPPN